jgi:hypothetical protein
MALTLNIILILFSVFAVAVIAFVGYKLISGALNNNNNSSTKERRRGPLRPVSGPRPHKRTASGRPLTHANNAR